MPSKKHFQKLRMNQMADNRNAFYYCNFNDSEKNVFDFGF